MCYRSRVLVVVCQLSCIMKLCRITAYLGVFSCDMYKNLTNPCVTENGLECAHVGTSAEGGAPYGHLSELGFVVGMWDIAVFY